MKLKIFPQCPLWQWYTSNLATGNSRTLQFVLYSNRNRQSNTWTQTFTRRMNTPLSPHQQRSAVVAQICGTQYKIESLSSVATLAMTLLQTWSQETAGQFNSYFTPTENRQSNTWTHTTQRPNHTLHTNKDALLLHGFQTQWWNWESLPTGLSGNDTCSNLATGSSQILQFILYPYNQTH